jgi:hypothetical protein
MKIIKDAMFHLLGQGRLTVQIGNRAIGHVDYDDYPDEWFIAVDNNARILRPLAKAESGDCLLYFSRAGFLAHKDQIKAVFELGVQAHPRTNPPYTWLTLVNHAAEFWSELETKTARKIGRLQKQIQELSRLSA